MKKGVCKICCNNCMCHHTEDGLICDECADMYAEYLEDLKGGKSK